MQLLGLCMFLLVVRYSFLERELGAVSAFDSRALIIVFCGSLAAIITSSSRSTALQTLKSLRELLPYFGTLDTGSKLQEEERVNFHQLWRNGKRAQAVELAESSHLAPTRKMLELVLTRASRETTETVFLEMRHAELNLWQPATANWEQLSKLGPSFGMLGTISGIIQLFAHMGEDNFKLGAAMSLALVSTLYGVALGTGIAGPFGHYLRGLLDQRLGVLARCHQSVIELASLTGGDLRTVKLGS